MKHDEGRSARDNRAWKQLKGPAAFERISDVVTFLKLRVTGSRGRIPMVLMALGVSLLCYVGSQYAQMYLQQRQLAERWQQQQHDGAQAADKTGTGADDNLIRLVIPKIDLTSFVVEGTKHHDLLIGPGHMVNTAEPGEVGNAVISAHRDTFFRHIHELEKGDQIFVDRGGKRMVYKVTAKKIVDPDDIGVVSPTKDPELTLITCYPTYYIGPAPKRLVVSAKLDAKEPADLNASQDSPERHAHVQAVAATSAK